MLLGSRETCLSPSVRRWAIAMRRGFFGAVSRLIAAIPWSTPSLEAEPVLFDRG